MEPLGTPARSRRSLRILAVANWDFDAVKVTWAVQRVAALRARGLEVEVLAEDCIEDKRGYLRLWRRLQRRLDEAPFDLVAPLYGSFLGLLCSLQRRVPCVISFAGSDLNGKTNLERTTLASLGVPASQLTAALSAGVSVRNREMRDAILWPPARRRAVVIGSGVDTAHFRPLPRDQACAERGVPVEDSRVLFVATGAADRPYKRLPLARAAVDRVPGAVLEIVDRVPFAQMPLVYASGDALLLTSINEGSPNCVKEALACGLPVISVDVGDVREVLEGLTNCAVTEATPQALGAALDRTLLDRRRCPEGPEHMARDHSMEGMVSRFVDFYEAVAARCPAPPADASSLTLLGRTRRLLAALTVLGALCGALLAAALPPWFEARAQLAVLPVTDPTSSGGINAADNASAALTTLTAVLQSASVADALCGRHGLDAVYGAPSIEAARGVLRRHVSISPDRKANLLTISVEDRSPRRARDLAAGLAELGKARAAELWTAGSREQRVKLEARLREVGAALQRAEDALRRFREENRVIDLAEQTRQTVSQVASFERARIEKEAGVAFARGFAAEGSSEVMRSERESAAAATAVTQVGRGARREALLPLGDLPRLEAEHARLRREIDVNVARYETVSRQIEQLRAFELMPGGHAELVDAPSEPQLRSRPLHGLLALEGGLAGLLLGCLLALGRRRRAPAGA